MPSPRILLRVLLAVALAATLLPIARPAAALDAATFVAKTSAWAQAEEREYGVPASVAMAQAILESGWGESSLTKNARNWFGIKCSSTVSPHQNGCYAVSTTEYNSSGTAYTTTAQFRKYDTDQNSFIDHGYFLSRLTRYAKAFNYTDNPDRFIVEVHLGGYATDPQYANKVINLMVKYNLYQYNVTAPATGVSELVIRPQTQAKVGATASVTGLLSPGGGGREILTQAYTASGWSTDQRVTSGTRGQFSIPLTFGTNTVGSTRYRVQAASAAGTLTSAEFTVDRLGSITVQPVAGVLVGGTARLKGAAVGYGGRTVTSQVLVSGAWQNHTTGTVNSDGSFDLPLTYGQSTAGTRTFRAKLVTAAGATLTSGQVNATWSAQAPAIQPSSSPGVQSASDLDGDGDSDLLGRSADGKLWRFAGDGHGQFSTAQQIGTGWGYMSLIEVTGDVSGDGRADFVARDSRTGELWLYLGYRYGGSTRIKVGVGWNAMRDVSGVGDFNGDGRADLLALHKTTGELWLYRGTTFSRQRIGTGWLGMDLVGGGDFNSDGKPDLIARERNTGDLWLHTSDGKGNLMPPTRLGTGWGAMDAIVVPGDFNGDRVPDLLARQRRTGTLWLYPGNGQGALTQRQAVAHPAASSWVGLNPVA